MAVPHWIYEQSWLSHTPHTHPDLVCLHIDNQKNGEQGQIISHHASLHCNCPVKACTNHICTLLKEGAIPETSICTYHPYPGAPFAYITNDNIVDAICAALKHTSTTGSGYRDKLVGSHLLCAGRATPLFNQGVEVGKIMKMGQWTSTAFMTYIHEQVDIVSWGIAEKMAVHLPFVNLDMSPEDNPIPLSQQLLPTWDHGTTV